MRLVEDLEGMTLGKLRRFVNAADASGTPSDSRVQMHNKRTGEVTTITLEYGNVDLPGSAGYPATPKLEEAQDGTSSEDTRDAQGGPLRSSDPYQQTHRSVG